MEDTFHRTKGVVSTASGYAGGRSQNPDYGAVCSGHTGHAEIVKVDFDPTVVSVPALMKVWFDIHDPTMDARHYRGGQYRSAVYFTTPEQEQQVREALKQEQGKHKRAIVSEVIAAPTFWRAEEYHQMYYAKNKTGAFCSR